MCVFSIPPPLPLQISPSCSRGRISTRSGHCRRRSSSPSAISSLSSWRWGGGGLTTQGVSQGGLFPQGALTPEGGLFPQGDAEANRARVVQPLGDLGTSPAELVSSEQDKNLVSSVGLPASAGFCLGLGAVSLLSLSFCPPPTPAPRPPNIHTHSRSRSLSLTHTHTPVFVFLEFDLR